MQTVVSTVCIFVVLFILSQKLSITGKNELDRLIPILARQQGVTEQLKSENQLKWIGLMNNIKAQAEEIIYSEFVYVKGA